MGQFKLMVLRERQRLENAFNENLFLSPVFSSGSNVSPVIPGLF